ncbi:MAG: NAD(P)/FAD-dependent oxidoreductase [Deltaproteobacteria bacterium]|nr:NAD(P)/FAD-dependent oxidoreductase [Deltaproteobacteria bacterium]
MYDAVVVGCGPAGTTAAYHLAKKGLKVAAFDKEKFPRYKSCGGCVSVKGKKALGFDITDVVENTVRGITFSYKSARTLAIDSVVPIGYSVMRDSFDAFLLDKARLAGAHILEGERVSRFTDRADSVTVETSKGVYEGLFLIGADGAASVVRRGVEDRPYTNYHISLTAEVKADKEAVERLGGRYLVDFGTIPHGYGWIFHKREGLSIGIAGLYCRVGNRIRDYFKCFVEGQDTLRGLNIGETRGWTIPVYHGQAQRAFKGRVLVAGDAGHLVDPFLGEGIYYAIKSGQLAASAVCAAIDGPRRDLSCYEDMLRAELYGEFEASAGIERLIYNYPRIWYRILEMNPSLMHDYYSVIRGDTGCGVFYEELSSRIRKKPWKFLRGLLGHMLNPSEAI